MLTVLTGIKAPSLKEIHLSSNKLIFQAGACMYGHVGLIYYPLIFV